jgi:hypothetical protein
MSSGFVSSGGHSDVPHRKSGLVIKVKKDAVGIKPSRSFDSGRRFVFLIIAMICIVGAAITSGIGAIAVNDIDHQKVLAGVSIANGVLALLTVIMVGFVYVSTLGNVHYVILIGIFLAWFLTLMFQHIANLVVASTLEKQTTTINHISNLNSASTVLSIIGLVSYMLYAISDVAVDAELKETLRAYYKSVGHTDAEIRIENGRETMAYVLEKNVGLGRQNLVCKKEYDNITRKLEDCNKERGKRGKPAPKFNINPIIYGKQAGDDDDEGDFGNVRAEQREDAEAMVASRKRIDEAARL